MAEIINLRRVRKQKVCEEVNQLAEANRQKFGRSKAEKELAKAEDTRATRALDAHKREE